MATARAYFDDLRSLAYTGISGSYAAIGGVFTILPRIICITNNTDGDMIVTDNLIKDKLFLAAGSFKLFDVTANILPQQGDTYVLPIGTQIWVKQSTAPSKGAVYVEAVYG